MAFISAGVTSTGLTFSGAGAVDQVSVNGTAIGFTIEGGDVMNIAVSGGTGVAIDTTVANSQLNVNGGGTAIDTTLLASAEYIDGGVDSGAVDSGGSTHPNQTVTDGGTAIDATIYSGGQQIVAYDGLIITSGGTITVPPIASGTMLFGGTEQLGFQGISIDTTIDSGGTLIFNDGFLSGAIVGSGGTLEIQSANFTGSSPLAAFVGSSTILSGGVLIASGGLNPLYVVGPNIPIVGISGGVANGVTVSVGQDGEVSGLTFLSGSQEIDSDAAISCVFEAGSIESITNAAGTTGTVLNGGTAIQLNGGLQAATTVNSGGTEQIGAFGNSSDTVVNNGGTELLLAGNATAVDTTVNSAGALIGSGAAVSAILAGGLMSMITGGARSTLIESGGTQIVLNTTNTLVEAGGSEIIPSGGADLLGTNSSGQVTVLSGGTLEGAAVTGAGNGFDNVVVSSGGTAGSLAIDSGARVFVMSGGFTSEDTIDGGTLVLTSGAATKATLGFDGPGVIVAGPATLELPPGVDEYVATVTGFAPGDFIDFAGVSATSANYNNGNDTLYLLNASGTAVASAGVGGSYTTEQFFLAPDGSGGTDVGDLSPPASDFTGDGMSDVLWQNDNAQDSGSGQTAIWLMNGVAPTSTAIVAAPPPSWHTVATGDFYGTGDAGILWQNDNGQVAIWEMNGLNPTSENVIASPPPSWHVIATGDFNGDGMSDILWQYEDTSNAGDSQNGNVAIWEMNGAATTAAAVVAQPGPDWNVVATGDFNGDGMSDILWQYEDSQNASDPQNGNVAIWEMNGLTPIVAAVVAQPGPDWHVVGTGDFTGNGMADILWQYEDSQNTNDPQNGNVAIWLMNGMTPTAEAVVANPGSSWHAIGTGDYDGSGRDGILWQNTNGEAAIWLMNGLTPTTESVFAAPPSSWHVIPS